jgi:AcrR family transcriptional regulator
MSALPHVPASVQERPLPSGLRGRKKEKTRRAIQDAALELFAEHGFEATTVDQIADRAEVSKGTFFRYFGAKGEVIFRSDGYRQEEESLREAVVARPSPEPDLIAVQRAIREEWVPSIDPRRVARQTRAAVSSPLLRGLSFDLGVRWQSVISSALAERRGLDAPDQGCRLVASLVFVALSNAVNSWVQAGCRSELIGELDRAFAELVEVCSDVGADASSKATTRR